VDPLVKRETGSTSFGAKLVPCLRRVDPSFMNSVTGFGYVAKCSNILQDIGKNKKVFVLSRTFWKLPMLNSYLQIEAEDILTKKWKILENF
jgi:hypothetical protein